MTLVRRALTVLIAAALAIVPVAGATAGPHASAATAAASAHDGHGVHHDHAAMNMAATDDAHASEHCNGKVPDTGCCDDEGACAQTCLQKCFGQTAIMPPERSARPVLAHNFVAATAQAPPGWSASPRPPPPRA